MIHQHLHRRALVAPPMVADMHLDEDSLSAFTEGRLSDTESGPVISHLVACGFCRRITAQLVRLESEIGPVESTTVGTTDEPGRIRSLLDNLASRVLPSSSDEAVFAYHAPAEDFKPKGEAETEEEAQSEEGDPDQTNIKRDDSQTK